MRQRRGLFNRVSFGKGSCKLRNPSRELRSAKRTEERGLETWSFFIFYECMKTSQKFRVKSLKTKNFHAKLSLSKTELLNNSKPTNWEWLINFLQKNFLEPELRDLLLTNDKVRRDLSFLWEKPKYIWRRVATPRISWKRYLTLIEEHYIHYKSEKSLGVHLVKHFENDVAEENNI